MLIPAYAQDYSGTWCKRSSDDVISDETFIKLVKASMKSYKGELVWNGISYDFVSRGLYGGDNKAYMNLYIDIYRQGVFKESAILRLYPVSSNRLDFISVKNGYFTPIYNMYSLEFATAEAVEVIEHHRRDNARDKCIAIAKKFVYAIANGDVYKLKCYCTTDFYSNNFPYDDLYTRKLLLSVPIEKRERLIKHINDSEITTLNNTPGDVITVIFTNIYTDKEITLQFIDEYSNGDWKVFQYYYYY